MSEGFIQNSEMKVVGATGSDAGRGKVGTIPAAGVLYVRLDCDRNVAKVDWQVVADGAHAVQLYRARTVVQSITITLAALIDNETAVINGLTYTAKDAGTTVASRFYNSGGADATADAAALAAVINDPLSGTIGLTAISALGVVTLVPSTIGGARTLQSVTGTAAGHWAVASTTLTGLVKQGAANTGRATTAAYGGDTYEQWTDGWPYAYLSITNNEGAAAVAPVVKATRYWV